MKRIVLLIVCGFFCVAMASKVARKVVSGRTSVEIRGNDLRDIVQRGTPDELISALSGGRDVNFKFDDGMTLIHLAALSGRDDMIEVLREQGADMNTTNNEDKTALQLAQENKHVRVTTLLQGEAEPTDGCDNRLHIAALAGDIAEVERLLAGGMDINTLDTLGRTALHYAALKGSMEIVNLLVAHNAALGVEDNFGNTARMAAQFAKHQSIVEVLEQQEQNDIAARRKKALEVRQSNKTCPRAWQ